MNAAAAALARSAGARALHGASLVCIACGALACVPAVRGATPSPAVGSETAASVPLVAPSVSHADAAAVATNGRTTLVVWQDDRAALDNNNTRTDIYGTLVRPDGSLVDKTDFPIAVASGAQTRPAVTWTGKDYLVVWQDARHGTEDIYGARVTAQGDVLDPSGIPIATTGIDETAPAVAADGHEALVVWSQHAATTGWDIAAQRVDADGQVLRSGRGSAGGPSLVVSAANSDEIAPSVSYGGTLRAAPTGTFLVAWEQAEPQAQVGDIYALRVSPAGRRLDAAPIPLATTSHADYAPKLVWNPTTPQWLAVWGYGNSTFGLFAVLAARIGPQGNVLDHSPIQVTYNPNDPADSASDPTVVARTGGYLVLYDHNVDLGPTEIGTTRVAASGRTMPSTPIAGGLGDASVAPAAAASGSRTYGAWADGNEIWGTPVASSNTSATNLQILTQSANPQQTPAIAWNGHEFLVAWADKRGGAFSSIYATRVTADGTVLDGSGIQVATYAGLSEPLSVSSDGSDFLVAWSDETPKQLFSVRVARITAEGTDLDANGIVVATNASNGTVASNGRNYLVAWSSYTSMHVAAALVTSGGTVSHDFDVSTAGGSQLCPKAASNGSDYLVTWQDRRAGNTDVYAARVASDGTVRDPAGIAVATSPANEGMPSVASDGGDFLVAWWTPSATTSVLAAAVSSSGTAGQAHVLDPASGSLLPLPAIAWTGSHYIATWQANVDATVKIAYVGADGTSEAVASAPIPTPQGSFLSASPFALATTKDGAELAYTRFAPEAAFGGVPRIFLRTVK